MEKSSWHKQVLVVLLDNLLLLLDRRFGDTLLCLHSKIA